MPTRQFFALDFTFLRKTQTQIGQRNTPPLTPQGIEQTPQAPAQGTQDRQGQPMQQPEKTNKEVGQVNLQNHLLRWRQLGTTRSLVSVVAPQVLGWTLANQCLDLGIYLLRPLDG